MPRKNAHCSYCGQRFEPEQLWPRTCGGCGQISYLNPAPIAVALVPVDDGLLCIRRSIEPAIGQVALPGGFMDIGETWQEAVARELFEETGLSIAADEFQLFRVFSPRREPFLLIFGLALPRTADSLPDHVANSETCERVLIREPVELAFPLHTRAVHEFFASRMAEKSDR